MEHSAEVLVLVVDEHVHEFLLEGLEVFLDQHLQENGFKQEQLELIESNPTRIEKDSEAINNR